MPAEATTFPQLLRRNRDDHGAKAALILEDAWITHAALEAESRALAGRLVAAGVGKGARVGLLAPNGIPWVVTAAAVERVGATLVPLSTLLRPPELDAQLRVAGITHLVAAPSFRGRAFLDDLDEIAPGVVEATRSGERHPGLPSLRAAWSLDDLPTDTVDAELVTALEAAVRPADDLTVLFTSGSRGAPKGAVHTHGGALRAVATSLGARTVGADDRLYVPMPFFWTGGFCTGLLSVLVAGATLLTEAMPEPERTLAFLERERVTLFRGWPDQAVRLAAHPKFATTDLSSLGPGSLPALLPPEQRPAPGTRAIILGMTETCGPYSGGRFDLDLPEAARGSCGRPFDGFEVRVADTGEIGVRGRNIMRCICGRTRDETFDRDGYYPTGDLGRFGPDGHLWFDGRLDDMFKVKGATVYPAEVEVALRSLPGVRQAHVTDVRDEVGALVVSTAPVAELVEGARARLSAFKVPTRWLVTGSDDVVPVTATAKVDKQALQALLAEEGTRT